MRTRIFLVVLVATASSCSSINLKAVEDPSDAPILISTEADEPSVLGTAIESVPTAREVSIDGVDPPATTGAPPSTDETPVPEVEPTLEIGVPKIVITTEPEPEPEPEPRLVVHNSFDAFATVGGFTLYLPAREVELVGFHESNHDGAQQVSRLEVVTPMTTMETRDRGNGSQTAIDVAVNRASEIRSPVTGTVVRSGTYTLYCQYSDDYAVIAPDEQPTWEVKILHIDGVQVQKGDRVVAQETVLAPRPTPLPFNSQIDKLTAAPAPPHVHIEVVDPSIPDRPSGGC